MRLVRWMAAASAMSAALAVVVAGPGYAPEILFGLFGPLAETVVSWVVADEVFRRRPERLTAVMITAFAGKLVFFGAYVAVMLEVVSLRPVPFVASFTCYFIALHCVEALALRRLFAGGPQVSGAGADLRGGPE
jgi:hypothetical protein